MPDLTSNEHFARLSIAYMQVARVYKETKDARLIEIENLLEEEVRRYGQLKPCRKTVAGNGAEVQY